MGGRSTRKTKVNIPQDNAPTESEDRSLPPSSTNPPMLFILPKDRSIDSRIVSLPDPATGKSNRFLFDPQNGIYEFKKISAPKKEPSSWLLASKERSASTASKDGNVADGYSIEDPSIFVATEVDPMFFMLPVLLAGSDGESKQLFITLDDHLDAVGRQSEDLRTILSSGAIFTRLQSGVASICDTVEAGDESMYRINTGKLSVVLLAKAQKVVSAGLPPSMDDKLVKEALQAPTTLTAHAELVAELEGMQDVDGGSTKSESQPSSIAPSTLESQETILSSAAVSTAATSFAGDSPATRDDEELKRLMRLRVAFDFILSSYVKRTFHERLRTIIRETSTSIDFTLLDKRLEEIANLKKEAQTLRSLSDNISRKRMVEEDDGIVAARAEKKRKKEEEEAKKKAQSRGIKQLAKADTSGMKKLSSFFAKGAAKKTAT
ncbi:hypothetical protein CAC42_2729 [Sphaceloma murrayae]|uniref:Ribonuclease H2 subunit B n=1 Tax=Sphaceloma murrayae TaxID=2082308 RepID=A0A2K1R0H1_9PEZI|nr:hypothetical protein CAC42_2729 [Sphaceloma murrayae]